MFDRLMTRWPEIDLLPEWPAGWGLTTEEMEKEFVMHFELPGFEPDEVKVELTGDRLTVEAEHKEPPGKPEKGEERTERTRVRRMMTIPPGIDQDKVEATYRNGILDVHIPRLPEEVGRRIEVKK